MRGLGVDVLVEHFQPNAFTRHQHEEWQFMVIPAASSGWMRWRSRSGRSLKEPITGAQVWIVPPMQAHAVEWSSATDVIKLYVDRERAPAHPRLVDDATVFPLADFLVQRPLVTDLCQDLRRFAGQPNGQSDWEVACTGSKLAAELMAACTAQLFDQNSPNHALVVKALARLAGAVADGLGRPPLSRIARELGVSPRFLSEAFQHLVKSPVREWFRVRRAWAARDLLLRGSDIKSVLHATGFSEPRDLNRALKREFNSTAAVLRDAGRRRSFTQA